VKILADQNIPLARELFGPLGEVVLAPGREVDADFPGLEEFDAMAIRSVTRVTADLIARAARLKALGTATIGTDHIDMACIERANRSRRRPIAVFSAPGSNADSVADYVLHALAHLTRDSAEALEGRSLGVIGCGNCGSRVARRAEAFGMRVVRCDPPRAEREAEFASAPFEEALAADFVTLHVPLTREGESPYPTHHMVGEAELNLMKPGAVLLNTARGGVVDSDALIEGFEGGSIRDAVLDVFEGEPAPPEELIRLPAIATPHVAGYAVESKRRGAVVIYEQICRALGEEPRETQSLLMRAFEPPSGEPVRFDAGGAPALSADNAVRAFMAATHDIGAVSRELKDTLGSPRRGELFDAMRRDYERRHGRHELSVYRVGFDASVGEGLRGLVERRLRGLGVAVETESPHHVLSAA
jgi:erythronate-4-phosphate dehydrogenase